MTQHLTKDKLGCMTINSNSINDNTQGVCLLSSMPFHRCIPIDLKNYRRIISCFSSKRLIYSNWDNHENVYMRPKDIR